MVKDPEYLLSMDLSLITSKQADGSPFTIQTPGKKHVMVTSSKHIKELSEAPLNRLSLHAVAKDVWKPTPISLRFLYS